MIFYVTLQKFTNVSDNKQLQIRNSTADFLIFTRQNGEDGIAVRVEDENVWLRVEAIATLFQKTRPTIVEHLKNIFSSGELDEISVCRKFLHTADDGKNYNVNFYGLEAIIAVGYRAYSQRAIQFRQWATNILSDSHKKGLLSLSDAHAYSEIMYMINSDDDIIRKYGIIAASRLYEKYPEIINEAVNADDLDVREFSRGQIKAADATAQYHRSRRKL